MREEQLDMYITTLEFCKEKLEEYPDVNDHIEELKWILCRVYKQSNLDNILL
jgi:hypothetical protein